MTGKKGNLTDSAGILFYWTGNAHKEKNSTSHKHGSSCLSYSVHGMKLGIPTFSVQRERPCLPLSPLLVRCAVSFALLQIKEMRERKKNNLCVAEYVPRYLLASAKYMRDRGRVPGPSMLVPDSSRNLP